MIDLERRADERGFFARAWCERGVCASTASRTRIAQVNVGVSPRAGTLRGMHYQARRMPK